MGGYYTVEEKKILKDRYFGGYRQVAYITFLKSKCTGINWIVIADKINDEDIIVYYKIKAENAYNRFSGFRGFDSIKEAISAMKNYDTRFEG